MKYLALITLLLSFTAQAFEHRQKIAVIDTGLLPKHINKYKSYLCKNSLHKSFVSRDWYEDDHGHGTNVVSLLTNQLDKQKYCLVIIKVFHIGGVNQGYTGMNAISAGVKYAYEIKAKFLNMSLSGPIPNLDEQYWLIKHVQRGTYVYVAAGNEKENLKLKPSFPACYKINKKYFRVVGSNTGDYSNYGACITEWEDGTMKGVPVMSGTSMSTPIALNKFIRGVK